MFQLPKEMDCEMSKFKFCLSHCLTWYHVMDGLILIRSRSYNTSLHEHDNQFGSVACYHQALSTARPWSRYQEHYSHRVKLWVVKPSETTIKRQYCPGNEKKLKQWTAVKQQNTADNLKLLLWILSIELYQHLLLTTFPWLCAVCLGPDWHNPNRHSRRKLNPPEVLSSHQKRYA